MRESPKELAEYAVDIAREAGKLLMRELPLGRYRGEIEDKGGGELVSKVDRASEALIRRMVASVYPDHAVLGEEGGQDGDGSHTHRWIVDPLDGTTNFLHGHPFFAVSIAVEREGEVIAAAVHVPYASETFFATRGDGAYLNSRAIRLRCSTTTTLEHALVATGFSNDRRRFPNDDNFVRVAPRARGMRRCGAAAIDLAFVACGRYDAFWELGLKAWDVAAGALLVREAGGRICDLSGGDDWLTGRNVVATNAHLSDALRALLEPPPLVGATDEPP